MIFRELHVHLPTDLVITRYHCCMLVGLALSLARGLAGLSELSSRQEN